ncbi:hypothetical protein E0F15_20880 [Frankia sp. B2]|uniref:Uncharacterized protein n=4 Tax=Frankiaceae TaxID=74712 RepID=Q2JG04_FRACC|nr:hypothetical protein Francci3_0401 [Frankia casuarinae]ORT92219.1 hypothetical protein UK99_22495 [Frankia casuarinae]TFE24812.1 hypothetical protein E0F15_20880 [Frankia sp. B2]
MGRAGMRAEQNALRVHLLHAGMTQAEIADEFIRRYQLRPRAAFRHAHGWTQLQAADHINRQAARLGLDPDGRASITGPYLCELEHWPDTSARRRLTPQILALLATAYGTDVHRLVDASDRVRMRPADRLVIDAMTCVRQPATCPRCRRREPTAMPRMPRARPDALASSGSLAVSAHPLPIG